MRKAIQIVAAGCLSVACFYVVAADDCDSQKSICFGLDWQTATEKDVRDWLKSTSYVKARNKNGDTPLHYAAYKNENPDVIKALLKAGADVYAKDIWGNTPLLLARQWNKNPAIISALVKAEQN